MNEGLSFATAFDTSGFEEGLKKLEEGIRAAVSDVEINSERIQALFTDIPVIDIKAITNMPETADQIGEAYAEINRATRINEQAIAELQEEYQRLTADINKFQNIPEKRDEVKKWREERDAIKENIDLRRDMVAKVRELEKVVEQNEKAFEKHLKTQGNVKVRIREVMAEMAALRNEAQMNGQVLDESTGRYRQLAEELGRLKDIQGDVATQAKILSNDENQFQGVISGLTGLAGAGSAAQGAMALLGAENKDLQEVMTKLQAVMAITIGLQQVQQTLNKDSAFRLVTLNSLRSLWNKLMGESNAVTATENASKATNISLTETQTAAEEANTAAEQANSAARMANNKAMQTGVSGKIADANSTKTATAALNADTVAQNTHTGAVVATTTATKAATLATKLFKMALITTGIGALIVGLGELVGWITKLTNKQEEANKKLKEQQEFLKGSRESYARAKGELSEYINRINNFNGSQEEEKRLLKEVNSRYGEQLGYAKNLQEAKDILAQKGEIYCQALEKEALAQAYLNKYVEAYIHLQEVESEIASGKYKSYWRTGKRQKQMEDEARNAAQLEVNSYLDEYEKLMQEAQQIRSEGQIGGFIDPNSKTPKTGKTFDPKEAARKEKEALKQYNDEVKKFIKDTNHDIEKANIDAMQEGLRKEIRQINLQTEELTDQWKQHFLSLARRKMQMEKSVYLSQKGNTEEGWEKSTRGKMSEMDYLKEFFEDYPNMAQQYYDRLEQITESGESKISNIRTSHQDQLIELYGSLEEKEEVITRQWMERMNQIRANLSQIDLGPQEIEKFMQQVYKAMDKDFDELGLTQLKKSINWEEVFGNMDSLATSSLESLKEKLQATLKTVNSPEAAKTITEAIKNIDKELGERNPFENLKTTFGDLLVKNKAVRLAQEAYNKALAEGNSLEIETAKNTLNSAKDLKQKALAEATTAMQQSVSKIQQYLTIVTTLMDNFGELGIEVPEQLTGFVDGMGQVLNGLSQINLTNPISVITGGITAIGGMIKGIGSLFNNDSQHQKNIEALQKRIDTLQKSYDKLGASVENAYSKDASNLIKQQNTLLEQQKLLIQNQILEEKSKKNTDDDKIDQWRSQIEEINDLINENKRASIDAIFGEDLKSAIENFADAYSDAWANGEDRAKSAKDTVKKMMQQMVQESIKAAIQSSGAMDEIRNKLEEFYADNVLTGWEQDYIYKMAENLQKELDNQFSWADSLMNEKTYSQSATAGYLTQMSEETGSEISGRLTGIQLDVNNILKKHEEHISLVQSMEELTMIGVSHLAAISLNTYQLHEINKRIKKIEENTR